jgi:hypothetical protein
MAAGSPGPVRMGAGPVAMAKGGGVRGPGWGSSGG